MKGRVRMAESCGPCCRLLIRNDMVAGLEVEEGGWRPVVGGIRMEVMVGDGLIRVTVYIGGGQGRPMGLGKLGDRSGPPNAEGPPFYTSYINYIVTVH